MSEASGAPPNGAVSISEKAWHYHCFKLGYELVNFKKQPPPQTNLCAYFWYLVLGLLMGAMGLLMASVILIPQYCLWGIGVILLLPLGLPREFPRPFRLKVKMRWWKEDLRFFGFELRPEYFVFVESYLLLVLYIRANVEIYRNATTNTDIGLFHGAVWLLFAVTSSLVFLVLLGLFFIATFTVVNKSKQGIRKLVMALENWLDQKIIANQRKPTKRGWFLWSLYSLVRMKSRIADAIDDWKDRRDDSKARSAASPKPSIFKLWWQAKRQKICPLVTFKQE